MSLPLLTGSCFFANGGDFGQRRLVCGQKRRHLQGRSFDAASLFLGRASLGVLKCPQGVRDGLWRPWGGVFRELPLHDFANGGRFDHQIVLHGQKRRHSQWTVQSVLADARRCPPTFADFANSCRLPFRCSPTFPGVRSAVQARFRGGVGCPFLFCARRRYTMVQIKKRCSKRCRPSAIRRSDYGRRRVHGKLR